MSNYIVEMKGFLSEFAPLEVDGVSPQEESSVVEEVELKSYEAFNSQCDRGIVVKEMTSANVSEVVDEIVMKAGWLEAGKAAVAKPLNWLGQKVGAASTRVTNYAADHPVRTGAMAAGAGLGAVAGVGGTAALAQRLSNDRLRKQQEQMEREREAAQRKQVQIQEQNEKRMIDAERKATQNQVMY